LGDIQMKGKEHSGHMDMDRMRQWTMGVKTARGRTHPGRKVRVLDYTIVHK